MCYCRPCSIGTLASSESCVWKKYTNFKVGNWIWIDWLWAGVPAVTLISLCSTSTAKSAGSGRCCMNINNRCWWSVREGRRGRWRGRGGVVEKVGMRKYYRRRGRHGLASRMKGWSTVDQESQRKENRDILRKRRRGWLVRDETNDCYESREDVQKESDTNDVNK